MIKGSICQEDAAILNVYSPNNRAVKHVKQQLTEQKKRQIKIIVELLKIHLSLNDRTARHTIIKYIEELNTSNKQDLINIYRTFHSTTTYYTFFLSLYRAYTKTDHTLSHETNLNNHQIPEIIECVL